MRLSLSAKIGLTLLVNLVLLAALLAGLLMLQVRNGFESLLLSPAQERLRAIGSEFGVLPPSARASFLSRLEERYGVRMRLYDRDGSLVWGDGDSAPPPVLREIRRQPQRTFESAPEQRRGAAHPVFLVRGGSRYWAGVHIPLEKPGEERPMRYALVFVTGTLLGNRLFFDWMPWALGVLAALAVSLACWFPLVRGILRSIHRIQEAAGQIAAGHFDAMTPLGRSDELGDLGVSITRMSENLSRLVHGQRRFLADVAHELCAPLSRVQLSAGILDQRVSGDSREYVRGLDRDVRGMSSLVGDLLAFSKGSARRAVLTDLPLRPLVDHVVASEGGGASIEVMVDAGLAVRADEDYLRRAVANLVRNAVRYAGESGPIRVVAARQNQTVRLSVLDEGPGLPESELNAVFEPFYRPDQSRDSSTGGAGLGLAIVKGCVEACGGGVSCRNRVPRGLEVTLELPAAAGAMPHWTTHGS